MFICTRWLLPQWMLKSIWHYYHKNQWSVLKLFWENAHNNYYYENGCIDLIEKLSNSFYVCLLEFLLINKANWFTNRIQFNKTYTCDKNSKRNWWQNTLYNKSTVWRSAFFSSWSNKVLLNWSWLTTGKILYKNMIKCTYKIAKKCVQLWTSYFFKALDIEICTYN